MFDKRGRYRLRPIQYTAAPAVTASDDRLIPTKFDSDSFIIGIDNHASRTMTNNIDHFIGPLTPEPHARVNGIASGLKVEGSGTVSWKLEDDNGQAHVMTIKGVLYVPGLPICLLSPQHWAKQANDNYPRRRGTRCVDADDACELQWDQRQYRRTVPWDTATNTARFRSAAGATKYRLYVAAVEATDGTEEREYVCYQSPHLISDDEGDEGETNDDEIHTDETVVPSAIRATDETSNDRRQLTYGTRPPSSPTLQSQLDDITEENVFDFTSPAPQPLPNVVEQEDEYLAADDTQAELLRWHYRLGHMSFAKIRLLASLGILPRHITTVKPPKCAGCLYGAMTKRPWRTKGNQQQNKISTVTTPGACVSVDQLESATAGFIAQLKGKLTRQRYRAATVFVDHFSRLSYIHLQRNLSSEETLKAKKAFEAYARAHGVRVKHYHADNGRFADNAFIKDVEQQGQTLTFCGVNAHFQNGIAEKRIRDLQERARKQLLHAKSRWPSAVELCLWPYALRNANHLMATLPDKEDGSCPLERFTGTDVSPRIKSNHTFGCPVYALQNRLQAGGRLPKWNSRARLGMYLGPSPRHASTVSLVLNLSTGCVSPQFHVQYDDFFETVRPSAGNPPTPSQWQKLAAFRKDPIAIAPSEGVMPSSEGAAAPDVSDIPPTEAEPDEVTAPDEPDTADADEEADDFPPDDADDTAMPPTSTSRYGRQRRPTRRMLESQELRASGHVAYSTYYDALHEDDYLLQDEMADPIAFIARSDPDTMYFHQAMKQPDRKQWRAAVVKEVNDHIERKHWRLIPRTEVPDGYEVLPAVWSMKRKRNIKTREVYKWKARLNVHGGKQTYAVNYFETFAPVVQWISIRLILVLALLNNWHTRQIDFVLAYPQANIEFDMYMELPAGIETKYGNGKTHVLQLLKNLYGQKQAGRVWSQHMSKGLRSIGFRPSAVDECVFYRGNVIFLVYVDDGIFASPDASEVDKAIKELREIGFDIEDQGSLTDYLGVNVERLPDGRIKLSQPHLIDQIIRDVNLPRCADKSTPAAPTKLLRRNPAAPAFDGRFNYRSVIGKLNFLEKSTRPDIAYATHQCARFSADPRRPHGDAVMYLAKYLRATREQGLILDPTSSKSLETYADADFAGNWNRGTAPEDASTAKSRTGYLINFADCPITWSSKLQTQIALSSTEAEYIALSQSLRDTIPIMQFLDELKEKGFSVYSTEPKVYCKAFEDNSGALELARLPKMRPRTKHINLKYHHFREYVRIGKIFVYPISTIDQVADIFTKPLPQNTFLKLRRKFLHF